MKKLFFCLSCVAIILNSCSDDKGIFTPDGIKEPTLPVETKPDNVVNGDVFSKLNLDYPGLEKVKQHYDAGEYYLAAQELLEYYRWRSEVVNPNISTYVIASAEDLNKANQALEYRFCVASYVEDNKGTADKSDDIYYSFKKDDGTINWGWKPDASNIDREFLYQQHRHQWMEPQARAYASTKNEDYVKNWIDVYSSWMAKYPCPNKAYDNPNIIDLEDGYEWKALQPTERVLSQMNIIQYYLTSPNFTPEWFSTVLNAFAESVEMIRMNYIADGNIRVSQGQAVASAGILFPEFKNADMWVTEGVQTMNMDEQFRSDGVHCDLDFSYHIAAISDYLELYNLAKANNKLDVLPSGYTEKLKNAINFVQDMIYPDYTIDNFNDTRSSSYAKSTLMNRLKEYLEIFPEDEELKWMAWEGSKGGTRPSWKSKAYSDAGYYMFRSSNWSSSNGIMMIHKNNENSARKWHCQPDNGTFSLWYKGVNFFPDAGVYSYNDPSTERSTYRKSTLHNTLSCQSKDILESQQLGRFLKQESTDKYELIVTENTPYKDGVSANGFTPVGNIIHRRAIFFVDDKFFAIVDEAYSDNESYSGSKINLNFHLYCEEGKNVQLIHNPKSDDNNYASVKTSLENYNLLLKTFSETNGSDFEIKTGVKGDVAVSNQSGQTVGSVRDYVQVIERFSAGKAARLITILYPSDGAAGDGSNISAEFTDNVGGTAGTFHQEGASVKVTVDGQEYELKYTLK